MEHCQDEPDREPSGDEEFYCESRLGINEVRMMYDSVCFYMSIWPGPPARPEQEKEYLEFVRNKLFAAIMEYNLNYNEVEEAE